MKLRKSTKYQTKCVTERGESLRKTKPSKSIEIAPDSVSHGLSSEPEVLGSIKQQDSQQIPSSRCDDSLAVPRQSKRFKKSKIAIVENSPQSEPKKSARSKRKVNSSRVDQVESDEKLSKLSSPQVMSTTEGTAVKPEASNIHSEQQNPEQFSNAQRVVQRSFLCSTSSPAPGISMGRQGHFAKTLSEELVNSSDIIPPTIDNSQPPHFGSAALLAPLDTNYLHRNTRNCSPCLEPLCDPLSTRKDSSQPWPYSIDGSTSYQLPTGVGNSSKIKPSVTWNQGIESMSHSQDEFCGEESVLHTLNEAFTLGTSISNDSASSSKHLLDLSQNCVPLCNPASSFHQLQTTSKDINAKVTPTFETEPAAHSQSYPSIGFPRFVEDHIGEARRGSQLANQEMLSSLAPNLPKPTPSSKSQRQRQRKTNQLVKTHSRSLRSNSQPKLNKILQESVDPFEIPARPPKKIQATEVEKFDLQPSTITPRMKKIGSTNDNGGGAHDSDHVQGKTIQHPIVPRLDHFLESQPCSNIQGQANQQPASSADTEPNEECHPSVGFEVDSFSSSIIEGTPIQNLKRIALNSTAVPARLLDQSTQSLPAHQLLPGGTQSDNKTSTTHHRKKRLTRSSTVPKCHACDDISAPTPSLNDHVQHHPKIGPANWKNELPANKNIFWRSQCAEQQEIGDAHQSTSISCSSIENPDNHQSMLPANWPSVVQGVVSTPEHTPRKHHGEISRSRIVDMRAGPSVEPNIEQADYMIQPQRLQNDRESTFAANRVRPDYPLRTLHGTASQLSEGGSKSIFNNSSVPQHSTSSESLRVQSAKIVNENGAAEEKQHGAIKSTDHEVYQNSFSLTTTSKSAERHWSVPGTSSQGYQNDQWDQQHFQGVPNMEPAMKSVGVPNSCSAPIQQEYGVRLCSTALSAEHIETYPNMDSRSNQASPMRQDQQNISLTYKSCCQNPPLATCPPAPSEAHIESLKASCENYGLEKQQPSGGKKPGCRTSSQTQLKPSKLDSLRGGMSSKAKSNRQTAKAKKKKISDQRSSLQTPWQRFRQAPNSLVLDEEPSATQMYPLTQPILLAERFDKNLMMQSHEGWIPYPVSQAVKRSTTDGKPGEIQNQPNYTPTCTPSTSLRPQHLFNSVPAQTALNSQTELQGPTAEQQGVACTSEIQSFENRCHSADPKTLAPCQTKLLKSGNDANRNPAEFPEHQMPSNTDIWQLPINPHQLAEGDSEHLQDTWMSHNRPLVHYSSQEAQQEALQGPSSSEVFRACHNSSHSGEGQAAFGKGSLLTNSLGEVRPETGNTSGSKTSSSEKQDHWKTQLMKAKQNPYIHAWEEYVFPASPDEAQAVLEWMMNVV